jgi:predicted glutamine amidotransferase
MCMLSYLPPNTAVDEKGLTNGGRNNPDGHGWAIVADCGTKIITGKSLWIETAIRDFKAAREENMLGPALFHSRWATHGSIKLDNVHPFVVGDCELTVVGHNGVFTQPSAQPWSKADDRSDTRVFADEILPTQFKNLDKAGVQKALTQFCGTGNKLVILTVAPQYEYSAYIINEPLGQWDPETGIWHSNGDYKRAYYRYSRSASSGIGMYGYGYGASGWDDDDWPIIIGNRKTGKGTADDGNDPYDDEMAVGDDKKEGGWNICDWCEEGLIDSRGFCDRCELCMDCTETVETCQCWVPDRAERDAWEGRLEAEATDPDAERWAREDAAEYEKWRHNSGELDVEELARQLAELKHESDERIRAAQLAVEAIPAE